MAIRQRGASFQADANVDGKRVRKDFKTEAEARAWVAEQAARALRAKVQRTAPVTPSARPDGPSTGPVPSPGKSRDRDQMRTWGEACERTLARYYANNPYEPKLRKQLERVTAFWGADRPLTAVDQEAMDDLIGYLRSEKLSGGTINRYLAMVSKVLSFAAPRVGLVKPKIEREEEATGRVRWLSKDEEKLILQTLRQWGKDEQADAVAVLIDTGMRTGELWKLEARDVTLETGAVHIWENKTDLPRTIYMTARVRAILEPKVKTGGKLFPHDHWWLRPTWDRARAHLGFANDPHFIPYICRHTCASRMVQRGVALPVLMKWMGHKAMQMTMRYAHLAPANLADAARVLEGDD